MLNVDVSVDATRNLGPKARAGVMDYLGAGADRGWDVYTRELPVDRGAMLDNSFSPTRDGDRIRYGTRGIPYAEAQDEGTGPFTPPLEPLLRWGDRTFGGSVSADEILQELAEEGWHPGIFRHPGAAVWSKILEEGLEGKHFSRAAREAQEKFYKSHDASTFIQRQLR